MDSRLFQRLRRRVERGERLSEADLRRLRTAADLGGGAALSITLGLALSNAGSDHEALSVLAGVGSAGSPPAALARARALVRAGRLDEAAQVLEAASSAHPGEVALRKGLVVVALRRSDRGTAERILAELRAVAPGDAEVRALAEAIGSGSAGGALEVLLDGRWEWFGRAGAWEHGGLRATWTEREERGASGVLAGVLPVLVEEGRCPGPWREGPAGLRIGYVSDGVPLEEGSTPVPLELLDRAAWRRLEEHPAEPRPVIVDRGRPRLSPEALGLWALCEADGADGARLLTGAQRRRLCESVGAGPFRVSLARRELALVAPVSDATAGALLDSVAPGPEGIAGGFVLQPDGTLQRSGAG